MQLTLCPNNLAASKFPAQRPLVSPTTNHQSTFQAMAAAASSDDDEDFILQTKFHIKFANLRAGISAEATSRQVRAALADQSWRRRPRRNVQPRSAVPAFVYPPRGVSVEEAAALAEQTVLYQQGVMRVRLSDSQRREGGRVVNEAVRHASNLVRCTLWVAKRCKQRGLLMLRAWLC